MPNFSDWKNDLREVIDLEKDNPDANDKKIDVMKGKNKITINPTQSESAVADKKDTANDKKILANKKRMNQKKLQLQRQVMQMQKQGRLPLNYSEDAEYGYDKDGNSLNPKDQQTKPNSVTFDGGGATIEPVGDPREIPTVINLIKNKLRARGLKMSHEMKGKVIKEDGKWVVKNEEVVDESLTSVKAATYGMPHEKRKSIIDKYRKSENNRGTDKKQGRDAGAIARERLNKEEVEVNEVADTWNPDTDDLTSKKIANRVNIEKRKKSKLELKKWRVVGKGTTAGTRTFPPNLKKEEIETEEWKPDPVEKRKKKAADLHRRQMIAQNTPKKYKTDKTEDPDKLNRRRMAVDFKTKMRKEEYKDPVYYALKTDKKIMKLLNKDKKQPVKAPIQKEEYVDEAKVDAGKTPYEKETARNKRNTPAGGNPKFDRSVFITRKSGESLDSARGRKRREAHSKRRGVSGAPVAQWKGSKDKVVKEDKAFDNVVASLRKQHGKGSVITKDNPPEKPTEAQKSEWAKERAKREASRPKKSMSDVVRSYRRAGESD